MKKEKIMIVFGGKSVEHDISIITALQVIRVLPERYEFLPVYIDKKGKWWIADNLEDVEIYSNFDKKATKKKQVTFVLGENVLLSKKHNKFAFESKVDGVLNCCHGNIGEDGCVQGLCKICNLAQTSAGLLSSAVCMDKAVMKDVLKANGVKTPEYVVCDDFSYEKKDALKKIKFPLIIKPANLGSSIAISVCKNEEEFDAAVELAFKFDRKIVVEKLVENLREFNCACFLYKGEYFVSAVNEVTNKGEIFSFDDKYLSQGGKTQEASKSLSAKIKKMTEKAYKILGCSGVVRIDFLFDEKAETLFVNEANTIPGSLAFYLFKDIPFKELVNALIDESFVELRIEESLIKIFDSSALENFEKVAENFKK
ncbi:MAG: D-alanine--D-alanine ligase [Clostridia bacterium]|nr:D-alanine--D-alanine ligase [Clostridia bacterium]